MIRKLLERFCCGFAVTVVVVLGIQIAMAQAGKAVVTPDFAARFTSESVAVLVQLGLVGLIGATFAMAAMVFELERWSFLQQGAAHFLLTAAVWVPVALFCWWPVRGAAVLYSACGWAITYLTVWLVQYWLVRRSVAEINRRIHAGRNENDGH